MKKLVKNFAHFYYSRPPAHKTPEAFAKINSRNLFRKNSRGTILIENVIFIILNVVFLSIIILFLARQSSGAYVLEESYAKQIALIADYGKPDMLVKIDLSKGMKVAENNKFNFADAVNVDGNVVHVKLRDDGGYSYSFFNDVDLGEPYPDTDENGNYNGLYVITISEKNVLENEAQND